MSALLTAMIFLAPPLCRVMGGNASYTKADKARRGGGLKKALLLLYINVSVLQVCT